MKMFSFKFVRKNKIFFFERQMFSSRDYTFHQRITFDFLCYQNVAFSSSKLALSRLHCSNTSSMHIFDFEICVGFEKHVPIRISLNQVVPPSREITIDSWSHYSTSLKDFRCIPRSNVMYMNHILFDFFFHLRRQQSITMLTIINVGNYFEIVLTMGSIN